jgi:hypothetical protein
LNTRGPVSGLAHADTLAGSYHTENLPSGEYLLKVEDLGQRYAPQSCTLVVSPEAITSRDFYLTPRIAARPAEERR